MKHYIQGVTIIYTQAVLSLILAHTKVLGKISEHKYLKPPDK